MDNPVFYVQMAHARIRLGIGRKAAEAGRRAPAARPRSTCRCSSTSASSTCCAASPSCPTWWRWPCAERAPHKVTTWVRELAGTVHGFYHDCYVVAASVPPELTQARLWLVEAARVGLAIGLDLLGCRRARPDATVSGRELTESPSAAAVAPAARHGRGRRRRLAVDRRLSTSLDLAAEFGTPLFVYDEAHLRARCREAVAAFGDGVAYATKAFLCRAMARLAHEEGLHLDVATGGELHVALAAGVPGRPAGAARQQQVRRRAAPRPSRPASAASSSTASTSSTASRRSSPTAAAAPDGAAAHHARASRPTPTSTSGPARTTRSSASAWPPARPRPPLARAGGRPAVELVGIHVHIGSQVFVADFFHQAVEVLAPFVRALRPARAVVGGGLGVAYVEGEEAPTHHRVGRRVRDGCAEAGITARVDAPSRAGRSSPAPRSPSTRSARSRSSRASAPTSRSTAA